MSNVEAGKARDASNEAGKARCAYNDQRILTIVFCIYAVSTLISMAAMSIGAGVLIAGMLWTFRGVPLLGRIREDLRSSIWERRYLGVSIALALACVASLVVAKFSPLSYGGKFSQVHLFRDSFKLWYLFWPLVILAGLHVLSRENQHKVILTWITASAALGLVAIVQHFTGWPRPQVIPADTLPVRYHATLFLGHHLSVASVFIFPFFASLDFARRASGRTRLIWGGVVLLGASTLILTYSRTLWMALPVGVLVWTFMNLPRRAAIAMALIVVIGMGLATQLEVVKNRFTHASFALGLGERQDLWKANLEFALERPLLGVGWKHNQELSGYFLMERHPEQKEVFSGHAHNNVLDMLGGTGVLGTLCWLAWCLLVIGLPWLAWRRGVSSLERVAFPSGLFCAWIAFQINGLTQVNFWEAKVTHQMMWMVAWSLLGL